MAKKLLSFIVPCFNEAGNILPLYTELKKYCPAAYEREIIFVDDGSTDETLLTIKRLSQKDSRVKYLSFTRNFGHQYALKAGLDFALGTAIISLDSDLQHPPSLIPKMIARWEKGAQIVYTKRLDDPTLPLGKRITSCIFYRFINMLSDVKIEGGGADYRLLDREVADMIKHSQESTLFLRGLVMWSGYPAESIEYIPGKRHWGTSKYSYSRMIHFAIDAITSFSILPLRFATILGLIMSCFTGLYGLYAIIAWFTHWHVITGWPSVIISVLFIGGLQLLILGILGEYIGKIFLESKHRPLYLIKDKNV